MKAIALAVAMMVPFVSFAQPSDAPVAEKLCLEPEQRIRLAQSLAAKDAKIKSLE